jgi:TetR/AcrR family transcriptional repressor of nem operon
MPYPLGHRDQRRARIVDSARRLFNRHGFDAVSIKEVMAGAGLTHGCFYSYFASKSDLYAEVLGCFFTDPNWKNSWEGVAINPARDLGPQVVRAYLSEGHFEAGENACPMVALPTDVARNGDGARRAFENVFSAMVDLLAGGRAGSPRHTRAKAIAALCVGGMVVARAMANRPAADELRRACLGVALDLGGWDGRKRSR